MTDLKSLDMAGLETLVVELGWEKYRAKQLFTWVWQKGLTDIDAMTNLARSKRSRLAKGSRISALNPVRRISARDGAVKLQFELADGQVIETVFIPDPPRRTVCVSTQVGCALACDFCFTGQGGLRRNLAAHEIADQVLQVERRLSQDVSNVVMMGMGEPLLNLEAVLRAGEIINADLGLGIGARHITISTAGIPSGIRRLAAYPKQFKLAVSLNAADDETRRRLMPIARKHALAELFEAIKTYTDTTRKRVTFEYVLIRGVNDRPDDAHRLVRLLKRVPCKINLIPFNSCPNRQYQSPAGAAVEAFAAILYPELPAVTIRRSKGAEIRAACGQLVGSGLGSEPGGLDRGWPVSQ
jgi:23S rRNA (adenine2503-C2)-methyltransferase